MESFQKVDGYFNEMRLAKEEKEMVEQQHRDLLGAFDKLKNKLAVYKEEINELRKERDDLQSKIKNTEGSEGELQIVIQELQNTIEIL